VIISGTGELANLKGTFHGEQTAVPVEPASSTLTYQLVGPFSGNFWFQD
jgi:hypothetical protein